MVRLQTDRERRDADGETDEMVEGVVVDDDKARRLVRRHPHPQRRVVQLLRRQRCRGGRDIVSDREKTSDVFRAFVGDEFLGVASARDPPPIVARFAAIAFFVLVRLAARDLIPAELELRHLSHGVADLVLELVNLAVVSIGDFLLLELCASRGMGTEAGSAQARRFGRMRGSRSPKLTVGGAKCDMSGRGHELLASSRGVLRWRDPRMDRSDAASASELWRLAPGRGRASGCRAVAPSRRGNFGRTRFHHADDVPHDPRGLIFELVAEPVVRHRLELGVRVELARLAVRCGLMRAPRRARSNFGYHRRRFRQACIVYQ